MKKLTLLFTLLCYFSTTVSVYAQIGLPRSQQGNRGFTLQGSSSSNLSTLISNVITLFFAVGGIGFTIMILWASVNWILAGGDKEKIAAARRRITQSIVGLVLLSMTFVIMIVVGQILGIEALYSGKIDIKGLLVP